MVRGGNFRDRLSRSIVGLGFSELGNKLRVEQLLGTRRPGVVRPFLELNLAFVGVVAC
jgi:hypothetical protein